MTAALPHHDEHLTNTRLTAAYKYHSVPQDGVMKVCGISLTDVTAQRVTIRLRMGNLKGFRFLIGNAL